jgi:hypothetical protein
VVVVFVFPVPPATPSVPPLVTTVGAAENDDVDEVPVAVVIVDVAPVADIVLFSVSACWRRSRTGIGRREADVRARESDRRNVRRGRIILVDWKCRTVDMFN